MLGIVVFAILLQIFARYNWPHPVTDFIADDWTNLKAALQHPTFSDATRVTLKDPTRPLSMLSMRVGMRLGGANPEFYTVLNLVGNALFLGLLVWLVYELTGLASSALLAGVMLAVLPNLVETFNWATVGITIVCTTFTYCAGSALLWVLFLKRGRWYFLLSSVVLFALAVFSYESGILLPFAYLLLLNRKVGWKKAWGWIAYPGVIMLYGAWRMTDAFGFGAAMYVPSQLRVGVTISGVLWNAKQIFDWWLGADMGASILNGLNGFATIDAWIGRGRIAGNILVIGCLIWLLSRIKRRESREPAGESLFSVPQLILFGLGWMSVTHTVSLVSFAASRLMVLPAFGAMLVLAVLLNRLPPCKYAAILCAVLFVSLLADQGTAKQWKDSGIFNRRLHQYLEQTRAEWKTADCILLDTASLRQRITRGLLGPAGIDKSNIAYYGNATMLRGFVVGAWIRDIQGGGPAPRGLLDVDHGAVIRDGKLYWHERFDPSKPYVTPLEKVFIVDCFAATMTPPERN